MSSSILRFFLFDKKNIEKENSNFSSFLWKSLVSYKFHLMGVFKLNHMKYMTIDYVSYSFLESDDIPVHLFHPL